MAQLTRHPLAPPPTAPEREATGHLLLRGYAAFVLFGALAHSFWYNLLGAVGASALMAALGIATAGWWVTVTVRRRGRARFAWRRLPWVAMGYLAWSLLSLAWSAWPMATLLTGALLVITTLQALFLAQMLTWAEIFGALQTALAWIVGLSLAFELWIAAIVHSPVLPNFFNSPDGEIDPHWYWSRGNLFDAVLGGDRIQGIVGNSNLLGAVCVLALIVFGIRVAMGAPRALAITGLVVAGYLFARAASATALMAFVAAAGVLVTALLMRRTTRPGQRTVLYVGYVVFALAGAVTVWLLRDRMLALLGRGDGFTGRDEIWSAVLERALRSPFAGNGFSSPWIPWDPAFKGWIVDHGITVFHAHNMWLDVFLQLGAIGVILMAAVYAALVWRSWFFAVDRPRWDARRDRPYSPLTLLCPLVVTLLLVQGLTESGPIMLWGWLLVVLLSFKLKLSPLVGRGQAEAIAPRKA